MTDEPTTNTALADNLAAQANPDVKPAKGRDAGVPVRLLYDTWDADEKRVSAGAVVNLPLDAAKALIKEGKAERADPLPGEK